jgi:hypothetical protein
MRYIEPNDGDTRTKTAFLWFPVKIQKERRWLERATWIEMWDGPWRKWDKLRWENK